MRACITVYAWRSETTQPQPRTQENDWSVNKKQKTRSTTTIKFRFDRPHCIRVMMDARTDGPDRIWEIKNRLNNNNNNNNNKNNRNIVFFYDAIRCHAMPPTGYWLLLNLSILKYTTKIYFRFRFLFCFIIVGLVASFIHHRRHLRLRHK